MKDLCLECKKPPKEKLRGGLCERCAQEERREAQRYIGNLRKNARRDCRPELEAYITLFEKALDATARFRTMFIQGLLDEERLQRYRREAYQKAEKAHQVYLAKKHQSEIDEIIRTPAKGESKIDRINAELNRLEDSKSWLEPAQYQREKAQLEGEAKAERRK
jgi:hypothetical protein